MKLDKLKATTVFAVILLMASVTLMAMPVQPVQAQVIQIGTSPSDVYGYPNLDPLPAGVTPDYTFETKAFLSFRPNPIGVGQSLLVNIWSNPGMHHAFYRCDYKVTMQKPDGTTVVVGPFNSYLGDATAWFEFIPDQAGTWKLKFEDPGTYIPTGTYIDTNPLGLSANFTVPYSVWYKPDSTDWQELTVQQDMVSSWPASPLPTDYWTRPANPMNREWWPILGNYPFTGAYYYEGGRILYGQSYYQYVAYVQAPNTAHIVWKRMDDVSGLIGGEAYYYTDAGAGNTPEIIYAGRCYNSYSKPGSGKSAVTYWKCTDLRTGELIWERPLESGESAPNIIEMNPPQPSAAVAGAVATSGWSVNLLSISGGRMRKYEPNTGAMTANVSISPVSSATFYNNEWALSVQSLGGGNYRLINWTTRGTTTNFTARIAGNITWPISNLGSIWDFDAGIAYGSIGCNTFFETTMGKPASAAPVWVIGHYIQAIDMYTGNVLWEDISLDTRETSAGSCRIADRGKVALAVQRMHIICWDGRSGRKLWTSEQTDYPWGDWWAYNTPASYDFNESKGAIIATTYDGVYAFDWDDGKILWHYSVPSVPFEGPYLGAPFFTTVRIADGKVYAYEGEHTPSQPRDRGWSLHCINATTGEGIWKIRNPMRPGAVADGYLTAGNEYDGYMYVFGKGKSQTTVTASPKTIANGAEVLIEGTVLDQSPAQTGTPCVAKDSMETQMEYLHLQMPIAGLWGNETITGVPVILTAIGSDGTVIDIGTTTTNGYYGAFGYAWTPPKEDTYTIMASFNGDDSYGSSSAATFVSVGPAPASPTPTPTPPEAAPDNTGLLYGIMAAVIIAIIVGIVAILLALRKRQ